MIFELSLKRQAIQHFKPSEAKERETYTKRTEPALACAPAILESGPLLSKVGTAAKQRGTSPSHPAPALATSSTG